MQRAIEAGELWRAKELLQGRIAACGYDPELLELLGSVLLKMGDTLEAGRFLFVAGVRTSESAGPIRLFLDRFTAGGPRQLFAALPRCVRRSRFEDLPDTVQQNLRQLNVSPFFSEEVPYTRCTKSSPMAFSGIGCLAAAVLVLVFAVLGVIQVASWILH